MPPNTSAAYPSASNAHASTSKPKYRQTDILKSFAERKREIRDANPHHLEDTIYRLYSEDEELKFLKQRLQEVHDDQQSRSASSTHRPPTQRPPLNRRPAPSPRPPPLHRSTTNNYDLPIYSLAHMDKPRDSKSSRAIPREAGEGGRRPPPSRQHGRAVVPHDEKYLQTSRPTTTVARRHSSPPSSSSRKPEATYLRRDEQASRRRKSKSSDGEYEVDSQALVRRDDRENRQGDERGPFTALVYLSKDEMNGAMRPDRYTTVKRCLGGQFRQQEDYHNRNQDNPSKGARR